MLLGKDENIQFSCELSNYFVTAVGDLECVGTSCEVSDTTGERVEREKL